jgi:drug/metabolite transporter (DMT)-like permease
MQFASPTGVRRLLGFVCVLSLGVMLIFWTGASGDSEKPSTDTFALCAGLAWVAAVVAMVGWAILWRIDHAASERPTSDGWTAAPATT